MTSTKTWLHRAAALAFALALVATMTVFHAVRTATPAHATAADDFVSCLNGSRSGDLIILVDTSASLQSSDAEAARVQAAEFLLQRLARSSDASGVELNVALAGFANRYEPANEFVQLNSQSVDGVTGDMRDFANRNDGEGTDYWLGLDGARRDLAERKQQNPQSCQGIVFFSDGSLDIDRAPDEDQNPVDRPYDPENELRSDAEREQARQRAAESMCRDGGLSDQLRIAPITLFGIGLTAEAAAGDFDLMERVSAGDCGAQPPNGQFTTADNIDELLAAFDQISGEGQEQEGGYCTDREAECSEGAHEFVLDPSVASVSILGSGDLENPLMVLRSPGGTELELPVGTVGEEQTAEADGVTVTWTWQSPRTFSVDMDKGEADQAWTGQWQVLFFDPESQNPEARSRTNIHVTGNVFPEWRNADVALRTGEEVGLEFGLADSAGEPVDPASLQGDSTFSAVLVDGTGTEIPIAELQGAEITGEHLVDTNDLAVGAATLRMTLGVTTADWTNPRTGEQVPGTELRPQVSEVPVTIGPAAGYPTLGERVSFGPIEGDVEASSTLTVTGPGCVWVDSSVPPTITTGPEEVTGVSITSSHNSAETCLQLAEGEEAQLPVDLFSEQSGNGALNGTFTVVSASDQDPAQTQATEVGYNAELTRPLNPTNFVLTLIAALVLGLGIPIGLLYIAKWVTAKIPGRGLIYTPVPVEVSGGQVLRDGAPIEWRDGDFTQLAPMNPKGQRQLQLGPISLQAQTGKSPFGAGHVIVDAPGRVGASSQHGEPSGKEGQAKLDLGVHNSWVMIREAQPGPNQTMVVFLTAADASDAVRAKLLEDLQRRGPQVYERLESAQGQSGDPGGNPAFAGAAQGQGGPTAANPFQGPGPGQPGPGQGSPGPGSPGPSGPPQRPNPFS